MIDIPLYREHSLPMYRQIAEHLRRMILSGALPGGYRLPGTRALAEAHGISRNTAAEAYALLEEEGLLFSKKRSGMYVQGCRDGLALEGTPAKYVDFATELPSPDLLPVSLVRTLLREEMNHTCAGLLGSPAAGFLDLRKALTGHAARRGIPALWKDVLVTSGVQEGVFLSLEVLGLHGVRRLWTEELTYPHIRGMAEAKGMVSCCLPRDWKDWGAFLEGCGSEDALFLVPSFQNPTGRTIPIEMRENILSLSRSRKFWVVEDDAYGELRYGEHSVPALKAMAGAEQVIYCGSFSQLLFPGIRMGYVLSPPGLWKECCRQKMRTMGYTSALSQRLVYRFLEENYLEEVLSRIRSEMKERMALLGGFMKTLLPAGAFEMPRGGIYLWIPLPGLRGKEAERQAREREILFRGGEQFYVGEPPRTVAHVRFSVSGASRKEILGAFPKLEEIWRKRYGC